MRLFITGGSGLIGRRLAATAIAAGHEVVVLSRSSNRATAMLSHAASVIEGDPTRPGDWQTTAATCDAIINLAGEGIFAKRWDPAFKEALRSSRVQSTRCVAEVLRRDDCRANVLVSASAVGYYGDSETSTFIEDAPRGHGFLAELSADWEAAATPAAERGARVVILRIGIVLDHNGGALARMLPGFRWGMGGPLGSGRQVMSWIHVDDLVAMILYALTNESLRGPVNATAPNPVDNRGFARTLGRILRRPAFIKVPSSAIRLALGEVSGVVLKGQRVIPAKAEAGGFAFRFPRLEDALRDLLERRH
ncbi:MAG: TIGR01777 family protein [bacterium]|nr:TIGR01777 family protein [bacterium]